MRATFQVVILEPAAAKFIGHYKIRDMKEGSVKHSSGDQPDAFVSDANKLLESKELDVTNHDMDLQELSRVSTLQFVSFTKAQWEDSQFRWEHVPSAQKLVLDAALVVGQSTSDVAALWSNDSTALFSDEHEVPFLRTLTQMVLTNNALVEYPPFMCNFTSLRLLDLRVNHLKVLPTELRQLGKLRELLLSKNSLTKLSEDAFAGLTSLTRLDLGEVEADPKKGFIPPDPLNHLKSIHAIVRLPALEDLVVMRNKLSSLAGLCSSLTFLNAAGNRLTKLPSDFGAQLVRLSKLNLSCNQLGSDCQCQHGCQCNPHITALVQLKELNLGHNKLRAVPVAVFSCTSLEILVLERNEITSLPREVSNLVSLETLWCRVNKLSYLPPEIGRVRALKNLSLTTNNLTGKNCIPVEIGELHELTDIDLMHNSIQDLPAEIARLPKLGGGNTERHPGLRVARHQLGDTDNIRLILTQLDRGKHNISESDIDCRFGMQCSNRPNDETNAANSACRFRHTNCDGGGGQKGNVGKGGKKGGGGGGCGYGRSGGSMGLKGPSPSTHACKNWQKGHCRFGNACHFSHGSGGGKGDGDGGSCGGCGGKGGKSGKGKGGAKGFKGGGKGDSSRGGCEGKGKGSRYQ
jgi:Leucine-rich repeat (LRR) protein